MATTNGSVNMSNSKLRKVECLVCQKVAYPPVMQCKNWHLVCNQCRPSLSLCPDPDCQEEINCATRSGVSEKFLEKYVVRCKYFKDDGKGCMEAWFKDDEECLAAHEEICILREVICLVPCCSQSVQLTKILEHFENVHFMTPNANSNIEYNVSEIIMQRKCIVNETCGDKTYKNIPSYLREGEDVFLTVFRISSLRQPIFELSTVVYPYYATSSPTVNHSCKITAANQEDSNAYYKWEGPMSQIFPLTPVLKVQDETAKLKWDVCIEIVRKS